MLSLSKRDARRLLAHHHFAPGNLKDVLTRLGSVQYDPLNPVGRNHDLVLQARVPGYHVGDWERLAYEERFIYDAWDKQASLVLLQDWPQRRIYHDWHKSWWDERILRAFPEAIDAVLAELRERGPLSSTAFDYQLYKPEWEGSWYGPKLTKNVLRALWHTGKVMTWGRRNGHHVYDLAERIVPPELYGAAPLPDAEMVAWLVRLRHQAVGLLRPNASSEVWSLGITAAARRVVIAQLVARDELIPIDVDGVLFHALPEVLAGLEHPPPPEQMIFVAPLDQLLWDRKAVEHVFGFDYIWEVYKPLAARKWGYYVLPVFYGDRFVARFDSRLKGDVWELYAWFWELDVTPDAAMLGALTDAVKRFKFYLGVEKLLLPAGLSRQTRAAFRAGAR